MRQSELWRIWRVQENLPARLLQDACYYVQPSTIVDKSDFASFIDLFLRMKSVLLTERKGERN